MVFHPLLRIQKGITNLGVAFFRILKPDFELSRSDFCFSIMLLICIERKFASNFLQLVGLALMSYDALLDNNHIVVNQDLKNKDINDE
ncbi:Uncharacterised protein [Legionella bozemanae]|uniref:Uncharacterized protein n=1 Tax=Legionella bozemanae TaxID=447 RepID=A0A0W0RXQ2_LEGBO|nr:hypothetical protein Lboz_0735 [Legionella bozemanae]STO35468.1 Uncharacterised protein [Legionella bozemanae]